MQAVKKAPDSLLIYSHKCTVRNSGKQRSKVYLRTVLILNILKETTVGCYFSLSRELLPFGLVYLLHILED